MPLHCCKERRRRFDQCPPKKFFLPFICVQKVFFCRGWSNPPQDSFHKCKANGLKKKIQNNIGQKPDNFPYKYRGAESASETEVLQMQTDMSEETRHDNAEAIDTLIAISVVAKVLADKLKNETKEGKSHEQNE